MKVNWYNLKWPAVVYKNEWLFEDSRIFEVCSRENKKSTGQFVSLT